MVCKWKDNMLFCESEEAIEEQEKNIVPNGDVKRTSTQVIEEVEPKPNQVRNTVVC